MAITLNIEPCVNLTRDLDYPTCKKQGLAKIKEELVEVEEALNSDSVDTHFNILEESVDLITATVTMLESLGFVGDSILRMTEHVNKKNKRRGYF